MRTRGGPGPAAAAVRQLQRVLVRLELGDFTPALRPLAPEGRVPVVLNRVFGPPGEELGESGPPRAQHPVPLHQYAFLLLRPLSSSNVRLEVVQPPVSALFTPPPVHLGRDERPLAVAVLVH